MSPDPVILEDYRGWLHAMAWKYSHVNADHEDLVQEGRIAMWQALDTYSPSKGSLPYWLTMKARNRMLHVVADGTDRKRTWTGAPPHHGGRTPMGAPESDLTDPMVFPEVRSTPFPESADMAYHRAEIRAAVAELPPGARKAIYTCFWEDGYVHRSMWIRYLPRLSERLSHLRDAR